MIDECYVCVGVWLVYCVIGCVMCDGELVELVIVLLLLLLCVVLWLFYDEVLLQWIVDVVVGLFD